MGDVLTYFDHITLAMKKLAEDERVFFLGQCVGYPGNALYHSMKDIDESRRLEMPVAEDMQMGMSIGLSFNGFIPVTIYPRFDFLVCASNQIINHLEKYPGMSNGRVLPKVIVRVCVGSTAPLYPGVQHCSDYSDPYSSLLKNIELIVLNNSSQILPSYLHALERQDGKSTILVEKAGLYKETDNV